MTTAAWVLLAIAGVFAVGDWVAVARGSQPVEYVCKPATLVFLIAVALALDPVHSDMREWFVVALAFSLLGDIFLMLPTDRFVFGLGAFLLGHVAYTVGLNLHTDGLWYLSTPVIIVAVLLAVRLVRGIRSSGEDALMGPVIAYVVVIGAMVVSAVASGNALAAAGALLFMSSDALNGETRFVRPRRWAGAAIMITYHLGQAGLVLSLVT
ncbi:MAG: lysoplasmalogenase [Acidimicrobiia bacterium]